MKRFIFQKKSRKAILSLGAESAGNFSVFSKGELFFSKDFGDLLKEKNFEKFKEEILSFIKEKNTNPDVVITDLHPSYITTKLGKELSKKFKATHIQIQHHHAHIFASIGDFLLFDQKHQISNAIAIAMDGTGFGIDEKIWGGEIFNLKTKNKKFNIKRIGHLENQTLLGGELAIKEPARMLLGILSKFLSKKDVFFHIKKHYNKNQFELLYNQLQQNFNCEKTSSTGRILDAVSVLLGFCQNTREFKHGPVAALSKNSTQPYQNLKPKIEKIDDQYVLSTTHLFKYLIQNIHKDKKRLADTAQFYIAQGLHEIILKSQISPLTSHLFISGGIANTPIISNYLESKSAWKNKKVPRGDAGLSVGQIFYYLFIVNTSSRRKLDL